MQEVPAEPVQPPKRQMFRPSEFFKNMLQQKEAEKEKKDAKAAQRPSVTVATEIHPLPLRKPSEGRKQEKPGQLLAAGGRFSMTVGENLNLMVGVQVLLEKKNWL